MTRRVISGCAGLLLIASLADAQQVVFSRRVYQVRGRSFQQLWRWSVADGTLAQLYDYAAGAVRLLTSAVSNNEEPTLCR
jgi:hypothetical protein